VPDREGQRVPGLHPHPLPLAGPGRRSRRPPQRVPRRG
jgi:hypothetical protein